MANLDDVSPEQLPGEESTEDEQAAAERSVEDTEAADAAEIAKGLDRADESGYPGD
jgi:hypothetical protein